METHFKLVHHKGANITSHLLKPTSLTFLPTKTLVATTTSAPLKNMEILTNIIPTSQKLLNFDDI